MSPIQQRGLTVACSELTGVIYAGKYRRDKKHDGVIMDNSKEVVTEGAIYSVMIHMRTLGYSEIEVTGLGKLMFEEETEEQA